MRKTLIEVHPGCLVKSFQEKLPKAFPETTVPTAKQFLTPEGNSPKDTDAGPMQRPSKIKEIFYGSACVSENGGRKIDQNAEGAEIDVTPDLSPFMNPILFLCLVGPSDHVAARKTDILIKIASLRIVS